MYRFVVNGKQTVDRQRCSHHEGRSAGWKHAHVPWLVSAVSPSRYRHVARFLCSLAPLTQSTATSYGRDHARARYCGCRRQHQRPYLGSPGDDLGKSAETMVRIPRELSRLLKEPPKRDLPSPYGHV
jgi:hypothetical protein